jgi:hypothetical protein
MPEAELHLWAKQDNSSVGKGDLAWLKKTSTAY